MRALSERSATMSRTPGDDARRLAAVRTLAVDAQTVEVMSALAAHDVEALLLKGPTLARLLYAGNEQRLYVDSDVLVSPPMFEVAEDVLHGLGYERDAGARSMAHIGSHGYAWRRASSRPAVDLHHTLPGVGAPPEKLWEALRPYIVAMQLQGTALPALSAPALAFHVALHAAHHGFGGEKSLRDLARALRLIGHDEWTAAAELAVRVDAIDAFGAGLHMLPEGAVIAAQLSLPANSSRRVAMVAMGAPSVALAADRLRATPGARAKTMLLVRKVCPPADFLRLGWPLARRGRAGLVLAYTWRLVALASQIVPAVIAWRRAGRAMVRTPDEAPS